MIKMMENSLETRKARVGKGKRVVSIWFVCVSISITEAAVRTRARFFASNLQTQFRRVRVSNWILMLTVPAENQLGPGETRDERAWLMKLNDAWGNCSLVAGLCRQRITLYAIFDFISVLESIEKRWIRFFSSLGGLSVFKEMERCESNGKM